MSAPDSIVRRVARTYVVGLALAALTIVVVSAFVGSVVVVWRDDHDALALGRLLATELEDHEDPTSHDRVVVHELAEQRWFVRHIEVWNGDDRIGGPESEGTLRALAAHAPGTCELSGAARACIVRASTGEVVVVASDLAPMLGATLPLLIAVALVALAVTIAFGVIGRRAIARSVEPLARFEAEVAAMPARAGKRTITRAWGSTELDSLASTFQAMLERIDEAVAREQRFVSDAAHELRTPLTRLRAQLELAREELRDGRPVDERLGAAVRTAIALGDTSEALLALARERLDTPEPLELADLVDACLERLDEGERARIAVQRCPASASGVEPLLALAVANLVDNALKYAEGPIEIVMDGATDEVSVAIHDRGPGIPEGELDRIRAPFVRGRATGEVRGSGLGLALADHVARLHRGRLELVNRAPSGLVARVVVPAWRPAA
jgi:signal transduction histidine kinase